MNFDYIEGLDDSDISSIYEKIIEDTDKIAVCRTTIGDKSYGNFTICNTYGEGCCWGDSISYCHYYCAIYYCPSQDFYSDSCASRNVYLAH